ncbi:hypothetical protein HY251_03440 [bacterium]|nr:hypothetical protein [bacterium]
MKRNTAGLIFSFIAILGFAPAAFAQEEPKPGEEKKSEEKKPEDGGGRRGWGGMRGQWGLPTDTLKEKLALTEDQMKKLEAINQEMLDGAKKAMDEARKDPNFDWSKMRENYTKGRDKVRDQIRAILTDEQKPKFEELVKQEDARMQGGGGGWRRSPEDQKKRLHDRAEKELALTSEEKAAVMPLVDKVLDVRTDARVNDEKRKEEFTNFVKKAPAGTESEKAEIASKLAEFRKAREEDKKKVKDAQAALREVLTVENEARLMAIGVLDE